MEKSRAIELLKLAVPIKALTQQEYADFVEAVNMGMDALVQPEERTEKRTETHACDLISRQAAIDLWDKYHPYIAIKAVAYDRELRALPSAQSEPTDINAKEAVYNLAEKIGIHQLFALTVELRGEPIQPEPKEGHWIWVAGELMCSECRTIYSDLYPDYDNAVACPHCGARMKGAEHETN